MERQGFGRNSKVSYSLVSKLQKEEVFTYSQKPHPLIQDYTHVFVKEASFINVCDRFMNLFSSSNTTYNHELVSAFLTNPTLEQSFERAVLEQEEAQKTYDYFVEQVRYYDSLLKTARWYDNVEAYEKVLDCEEDLQFYESLDNVLQLLRRCHDRFPVICIQHEQDLLRIYDSLEKLQVSKSEIFAEEISSVIKLFEPLSQIQNAENAINIEQELSADCLHDILIQLQAQYPEIELQQLSDVKELYENLGKVQKLFAEADELELKSFLNLYYNIINLIRNDEKNKYYAARRKQAYDFIEGYKTECPVKGSIYIVGGVCLSADKVIS